MTNHTENEAMPTEALSEAELLRELEIEEELKLARQRRRANVFWALFGLLMLAVLVGQYFWFTQRNFLLQHAQIRPWLEQGCELLQCQLPPSRDLQQFNISKKYMDKHNQQDNAVLLHFIFSNEAHFPQPYPGIEIRFEDENRKPIGIHRLRPENYASDDADLWNLQPHQAVHVNLELGNAIADMHTFGYAITFL